MIGGSPDPAPAGSGRRAGERPRSPGVVPGSRRGEGWNVVETTEVRTSGPEPPSGEGEPTPPDERARRSPRRVVALVLGAAAAAIVFSLAFGYLHDPDANRVGVVAVAIVVGVGGVFLLFWVLNRAVDFLPERFRETVRPYVFVGPALVLLLVFLVYPVFNTIFISLRSSNSDEFVGLDNYRFVFTDAGMLRSIRNTAGWLVLVPIVAVEHGPRVRGDGRPAHPG